MATYAFTGIAFELHQELNEPSDPSQSKIGLWLQFNAGKINNKISKSYEVVSGEYEPLIEDDEKDILKSIYYVSYYNDKARDALVSSTTSSNILSIRDDVSSVSFVNAKETAKEFYNISKDYELRTNDLVNLYKHNRSGPRDPQENITGFKY
jgi:hypothetical protein